MSRRRQAPIYRSLMFVPAHRPDLALKSPAYAPDAIILDLEDAVPAALKDQARAALPDVIDQLPALLPGVFVRVNAWGTGLTLQDVTTACRRRVGGILLPKVEGPDDVVALDRVLSDLEVVAQRDVGQTEIVPLCETATGKLRHVEVCRASPRIVRTMGVSGAVTHGDAARELGLTASDRTSPEEYLISIRSGLEARAAGVQEVIGGLTDEYHDLDFVRLVAERARAAGATGSMAIHPAQVPVLNEVFSPTSAQLDHARAIVMAMADALDEGHAATTVGTRMVDIAHARTALALLDRARRLGLETGPVPDLQLPTEHVY